MMPASQGATHSGRGTNHRGRYRQIAETLAYHGLHFLLDMMDLQRRLPLRGALLPRSDGTHTPPERLRLVLEALGAAFIELGESSPPGRSSARGIWSELAKLQDQAPEVPYEVIARCNPG